jgi:hypothetical protein
MNKRANYFFVSDYAVVIITSDSKEGAAEAFRETVRNPEDFALDRIEYLDGRVETAE